MGFKDNFKKDKKEDLSKENGDVEEILDENVTEVVEENEQQSDVVTEKENEIVALNDRLLRTMAEYDNYRKRTSKQIVEKESEVVAKTVSDFLPVLDNLERACENDCTDTQYKDGVVMILAGMKEVLSKLGIEEIDTTASFDPNLHQAVQQVEVEGKEAGEIAIVFQKGYRLGERIIRFAVVAVTK